MYMYIYNITFPQRHGIDSDEAVEEEEFFDIAIGSSSYSKPLIKLQQHQTRPKIRREKPTAEEMGNVPPKRKIKKQRVSPQYSTR